MKDWDHLLVDGYNVLMAGPQTKKWMRQGMDVARDRLSGILGVLHDYDGIRLTMVFDGRGPEITLERPRGDLTFSYLYTPTGVTADAIIEQLVSSAALPDRILVATRDNLLRETVHSYGATVWTPQELFRQAELAQRRQSEWLQRRGKAFDS